MRFEFGFIGFIVIVISMILFNTNSVIAHNFKSDESAEFLTFVDKVRVELQLVLSNVENNDINLAKKHSIIANDLYWLTFQKEIAEKNNRTATNLKLSLLTLQNSSYDTNSDIDKINTLIKYIEDTLAESISIRVNPEHINNSTIQMLHLTNLLNSIDIYYTKGVDTSTPNVKSIKYSHINNSYSTNDSILFLKNYTTTVIDDPVHYQSASQLARYTVKLFDTELSKYLANDKTKIEYIHNNLENLKNSIDSKMSYEKIYDIISSTQSMLNQNFKLSLT
jgi:hypothetical protein